MNVLTVVWSEYEIFKSKFWSITSSAMISPILYMIAFGWGLGSELGEGTNAYINYIISGIVGMTSMTASYSAVASSLNTSRIFYKTFEEFMMSPIKPWEYTTGKIIAGVLRGLYSCAIITVIALIFAKIDVNARFLLSIAANAFVFASLGFIIGMVIDSHTDINKFNSFIITPMSFLCGTFFPVDKMPGILKDIVGILPLSLTNENIRNVTGPNFTRNIIILLVYLVVFYVLGVRLCNKAE